MNRGLLSFTKFTHIRRKYAEVVNIVSRTLSENVASIVERQSPIIEKSLLDDPPKALELIDEDLSDVGKHVPGFFNLAYYVNSSETLQNLVKLGVDLYKIEKKPKNVEPLLRLDFERDIKKYLIFLNDFVEADSLGQFITKNPMIFSQDLDHLQTRINYLYSKKFDSEMIKRIVTRNPFWLMFSTVRIDKRLGYFQKEFDLSGQEVRLLTTKQPKLITYSLSHVNVNKFAFREEMGFNHYQMKSLLLDRPRLLMQNQLALIKRFNYVHLTMEISHKTICNMPQVLLCRKFKIKQRHEFLKKIGRAQYDNTKPLYVSLVNLVEGTDADFCYNVAKCDISEYNLYLKSL